MTTTPLYETFPNLFDRLHEHIYMEDRKMSLVLHGTLGDYSYNVVTNAFDLIQVQFDVPEDHPLFGKTSADLLDFCDCSNPLPFSDIKTVTDKSGTTTWALCDIPVEDCLFTLDRPTLTPLMWPRVMTAALAAYQWLKYYHRKNYIADNGNNVN